MRKTIMIQGTASGVGKSLLTTALCRILYQDGFRVAPFKAVNISLNSGVTKFNEEIAISQIVQAQATGIEPQAIMNPFLIKPPKSKIPQVIIKGKVANDKLVQANYISQEGLWSIVKKSFDKLIKQYEVVVLEGAASPAEPSFIQDDIVNIKIAKYAQSPILLIADINKGGVFASLEGTISVLRRHDLEVTRLIKGIVINKYQGRKKHLSLACQELTEITGIPVLGIIPFIENHGVADEDTWNLPDANFNRKASLIDIVIIRVPTLQNSHEFDSLIQEPQVQVRFISSAKNFGDPDLVILPGSKTTISDLWWMRLNRITDQVLEHADKGKAVVGICGGFQMLGKEIQDPNQIESTKKRIAGFGLLPAVTIFKKKKIIRQTTIKITSNNGLLRNLHEMKVSGYEIHMGRTKIQGKLETNLFSSLNGWILGTYLHDIFKNNNFRHTILRNIALKKGIHLTKLNSLTNPNYDYLAKIVRQNLNMKLLYQILKG